MKSSDRVRGLLRESSDLAWQGRVAGLCRAPAAAALGYESPGDVAEWACALRAEQVLGFACAWAARASLGAWEVEQGPCPALSAALDHLVERKVPAAESIREAELELTVGYASREGGAIRSAALLALALAVEPDGRLTSPFVRLVEQGVVQREEVEAAIVDEFCSDFLRVVGA